MRLISFAVTAAVSGLIAVALLARGGEPVIAAHGITAVLIEGADDGRWHEVKMDETLRSIALHYYGSARHWRTLQLVNNAPVSPSPGSIVWIPGLRDEMDGLTALNKSP